eukprot:CAMPEP_0179028426 /NCGR_PEP_ID=MMETSP0796-20121207/9540_1 /TAXON_ID=73915 /ORGANISM="Pyrodinium bahamense, Strain pbaha01" /LENGTH=193 /DNA_ID=CAMNT_0020724569 /DNA_START=30 /DNA_END=613 /DNA_ORIENTATION=-
MALKLLAKQKHGKIGRSSAASWLKKTVVELSLPGARCDIEVLGYPAVDRALAVCKVPNSHIPNTAPISAHYLCKRSALLQVTGVFIARERAIDEILGYNVISLVGLKNNIAIVPLAGPLALDVLCGFDYSLVVPDALVLPGGIIPRLAGEHRAHNLPTVMLSGGSDLGCSHVAAAQLVDAEPGSVLRALVKHR